MTGKELSSATCMGYNVEQLIEVATLLREKAVSEEELERMIKDGKYCFEKWFEIFNSNAQKQIRDMFNGIK